jgi:polyisoprenoid-binding protein YceI
VAAPAVTVEAPAVVAPDPAPVVPVVPAPVEPSTPPPVVARPAAPPAVAEPAAAEPVADAVAAVDPVEVVAEAAVPAAADYALVPERNSVYVVVTYQRGTLAAAMAHDHVVVATQYSGTVHWDPSDPSACRVAVDVPTSGLRVDPPGARARAGLEGDAPVEDQPKIEENFNSKKQLDSGVFPVLTFRSERCAARPDGRIDVTGPLTIHGVSRPTTIAMDIDADGETFTARGELVAKHADFGMTPFSAAMGAVKNAEPLAFTLGFTGRVSE